MPEIRKDLVKNHWVALANDQALKPCEFPIAKKNLQISKSQETCPFCEGHENLTPPEIYADRIPNTIPDSPGWNLRVIPNKFTAFTLQGEFDKKITGIYTNYNGLGKHEVVIETPNHNEEFFNYDQKRIESLLSVFQQRYSCLAQDNRIKYIQIYKNRGMLAGSSLEHSHSQILAFPFLPRRNEGLIHYHQQKGHCLICDMLQYELESKSRLVWESEKFILICPYASRFSYETWIIPRRHMEHFPEINTEEISELAFILLRFTNLMKNSLNDPAYNFIFNTAPLNSQYKAGNHWYMEITPRMLISSGVEIASGVYMNPVAPELAASMLYKSLLEI